MRVRGFGCVCNVCAYVFVCMCVCVRAYVCLYTHDMAVLGEQLPTVVFAF